MQRNSHFFKHQPAQHTSLSAPTVDSSLNYVRCSSELLISLHVELFELDVKFIQVVAELYGERAHFNGV